MSKYHSQSFSLSRQRSWGVSRYHASHSPSQRSPLNGSLLMLLVWRKEPAQARFLPGAGLQPPQRPVDAGHTALLAQDGQALEQAEAHRPAGDGHAQGVDDLADLDPLRL